jgi:hypothetical protein
MYLLGLDLESTNVDPYFNGGISPERDRILEYCFCIWNISTKAPVMVDQNMVMEESMPCIPYQEPYIVHPWDDLMENGTWEKMSILVSKDTGSFVKESISDIVSYYKNELGGKYIVAHGGNNFDLPMIAGFMKRCGMDLGLLKDLTWIDTQFDINYPAHFRYRNLPYLCGMLGIINKNWHRAYTDIIATFELLTKFHIQDIINNADTPMVRCIALVDYEHKEIARKAGFYWERDEKIWYRVLRKSTYELMAPIWNEPVYTPKVKGKNRKKIRDGFDTTVDSSWEVSIEEEMEDGC